MLTILVADDDLTVCRVLEGALTKRAYKVVVCTNGDAAWKVLTTQSIDIAILDWFMPGLTGPEISERYAKLEDHNFVYMLILSGHMDKKSVMEALHRGAHDVMEKPCDLGLLESRLSVAAKILKEKRTLEEMALVMQRYATQMEQLATERAQQLVHAERMSSLGVLAAGVAHEINNPMNFISGNLQSMQRYWSDLLPMLNQASGSGASAPAKIKFIIEEVPKIFEGMTKGVQRVTQIVKGLKKYSGQRNAAAKEVLDINSCVKQALELCQGTIGRHVIVSLNLQEDLPAVLGNAIELEQVLVNLLVNAAHAMEGREERCISISTFTKDGSVTIWVDDNGTGIEEKMLTSMWDPFVTSKPLGKGTGLGLSISSGIVREHGGTIFAKNREEGGARITVQLPMAQSGEIRA
ncbi:MAG: response regulator [Oligoflexia bacterium]|nr:response regulator [Oligoflexia bacterium]